MDVKGFAFDRSSLNREPKFLKEFHSYLNAAGHDTVLTSPDQFEVAYKDGFIPVIWGLYRYKHLEFLETTNHIVMECGYFGNRTEEWCSIAWNGINGRGDHREKKYMLEAPRWEKQNVGVVPFYQIERWFTTEKKIPKTVLIVGQVATDQSLVPFIKKCIETKGKNVMSSNFPPSKVSRCESMFTGDKTPQEIMLAVYSTIFESLRAEFPTAEIFFKGHPKDKTPSVPSHLFGKFIHPHDNLEEVLGDIQPVVYGVNSNALVIAAALGYPTVAMDVEGSMVGGVASMDYASATFSCHPKFEMPLSRRQWFNRMTWMQWHIDEIKEGEMFKVIMS